LSQWPPFRKKYLAEIMSSTVLVEFIEECSKHPTVTLLYGSKDEEHNHALILAEVLKNSAIA
jgi:uncharacterized protein YeaO (DUF488 family)